MVYGGGGEGRRFDGVLGLARSGSLRELLDRAASSRGWASLSHKKNLHRSPSGFWQDRNHLPLFGPGFLVSKCIAGCRGLQSPGKCQSDRTKVLSLG
jgi:hypothetical protein